MKTIGLTGGIASGKTTVSNTLRELGAVIIDADKIAREVVEKGKPAYVDIVSYFGEEILLKNDQLDRKKLGSIVFSNPCHLEKLNQFTHPRIFKAIDKKINYYKQNQSNRVIILDAALLIETDLKNKVDEVWIVVVPKILQIQRLMERDGLSFEEANQRIKSQMPTEKKIPFADRLINNSGDLEELIKQVKKIWGMIMRE
ncbi:dephospho-CoA kinase [Anaerovirgula multivorans]|uniref:Dephospho-CoA kinase n=1 Tax=Anaerovirgula multivorans TaxID=312168 RepID=A0A239HVL5_9FIRM|nr:dephospho-CoA kinase [Anaerovirgula multivorans]SNS85168.1 dephospho-CoA kinase [Anaerovirgula multivorans]